MHYVIQYNNLTIIFISFEKMNLNENYLIQIFDENRNKDLLGLDLGDRGLTEIRSDTLNLKDNDHNL